MRPTPNNHDSINIRTSYDRVAGEYVRRIYNKLQNKPLDRQLP